MECAAKLLTEKCGRDQREVSNYWRIQLHVNYEIIGEFRYMLKLALDDVIGQCTNTGDGNVDDVARP